MAMAGRIRSSLPLLSRMIAAADSLSGQRCALSRALLCPTFSKAEVSRNYSTDLAKKGDKVKVPLVLYGGSGNYATALYVAAVKANTLEMVESEFVDLVVASGRSPTLSQFMKDLTVPAGIRVKAITAICDEAKFSEVTKKFLVLLAENGRLRYLDDIVKKFRELTMAHRGEVKAIVTTVIPLPPEEEKELKEAVQDVIGKGKKVILEQKIDPSILGGIVVEFDMKVFDMSIVTRAKQMERFLREPTTDLC